MFAHRGATLITVSLAFLAACVTPSRKGDPQAYPYDRVAEVTNLGPSTMDIYSSASPSDRTLLGTVRPGETVRVTVPNGGGVSCSPAAGGVAGSGGRCEVRYLETRPG